MTTPANGGAPIPDGSVTVREVYHLINQMRAEIRAEMGNARSDAQNERAELKNEVQSIAAAVQKQFDDHEAEHTRHEVKHDQEDAHTKSLIRWAVTTVMSGAGVAVAIYVAFKTGGG